LAIQYIPTAKGRVLVRFETSWWEAALNEKDRLVMLSMYMRGEPMTSKEIAEDSDLSVSEVEGSLRRMIDFGYTDREFGE